MKWIDKKYEVIHSLGGGGFSDVYLVKTGEGEVALKLLKTDVTLKPNERNLICFKNEFSILKKLNHPNIARILDFGLDQDLQQYYFTAELVKGDDLYKATDELNPRSITDYFVQALRSLEYIHSYRIYHFDIKAANLLITKDNQLKLIDFGLASLDPKGDLMGTPSYMAPEIIKHEKPDGRADIYSLGVLWYYCLTRKNPFRSADSKITIENHKNLVPPPPSKLNPAVPEYIDQIIGRMLQKRPDMRYGRASDIIKDMNLLGGLNIETETSETLLSYIPEKGRFIGRKKEIDLVKNAISGLKKGKLDHSIILVTGKTGSGKDRFLDEIKYYAQMNDISTNTADGHDTNEIEELLKETDQHIRSGEAAKAFLINSLEWLEATPPLVERLKTTLSRIPVHSQNGPILFALGLDEESPLTKGIAPLTNISIRLANFNRDELKEYITALTGLTEVPESLLEEILKRTEGNPLFVTEITKSLVANGALFDSKGRWKKTSFIDLGVDFKKILPPSLKELLMERYNELCPEEKIILMSLSVAARPASSYEISLWTDIPNISSMIEKLIMKDMLVRETAYNYYFRNRLLAGYVYEDLPIEKKESFHDKIAGYIINFQDSPDEASRHIGLGSDHRKGFETAFETGKKYLKEGLGRTAIEYLSIAASRTDVISQEENIELDMKLGEAHLISQDYKNALLHFNSASGMLSGPQEPPQQAAANSQIDNLIKIGGTYIKLCELDKAKQSFLTAETLLKNAGDDPAKRLLLENFKGYLALQECHLDEAEEIYTRSRVLWSKLGEDQRSKVTNNELGMVLLEKGETKKAIDILKQDLSYFEEIKDELLIARRHYNIAQAYQAAEDMETASLHFQKAAKLSQETRDIELLLCVYNGMGNICNIRSNFKESLEYYDRARNLAHQLGDWGSHAAITINIGIIENKMGHTDIAFYELHPAITYLKHKTKKIFFDWQILCRGQIEMSEILIKKGDIESAGKAASDARETAGHIPEDESLAFWLLWTEAHTYKEGNETELFASAMEKLEKMARSSEEKDALETLKGRSEDDMEKSYRGILEINKLINSESDLPSVLKLTLKHALDLSGAESAAVVLKNQSGELEIAAHKNICGENWDADISYTFAKEAITGETIIESENAVFDPRFSSEESVKSLQLKSVICIPIHAYEKVIGALYMDSRTTEGVFKKIPRDILITFTDQIGIAIDKAKKIEALNLKSRRMENQLEEMSSHLKDYEKMMDQSVHGFVTEYDYSNIVGRSKVMCDILKTVDKIVDTDISVLLTGESGTGKELIAHALHFHSGRAKSRFVTINCGAISPNLVESELFGYKAGAFTGAVQDKKGLFEEADGGTIFLDEVTEIDPSLQVKLLRVIQTKEFTRVGDIKPHSCDVRIVSATNKDINKEVSEGRFREDLYWRICQLQLHIPPLRDRREDIPLLTKHFLKRDRSCKKIVSPLLKSFMEYDWPGNIRELENMISVISALSEGEVIDEKCVPKSYGIYKSLRQGTSVAPRSEVTTEIIIDDKNYYRKNLTWQDYENRIIAKAFEANNFRARPAAKELGIVPTTMYNKIKLLGLEDKNNPLYKDPFEYTRGHTLRTYVLPIFKAALMAAKDQASKAISSLGISQGFFYKIMRQGAESPPLEKEG